MNILITGFEPFGKDEINSSWESVKLLPNELKGNKIYKVLIPVVFNVDNLIENIKKYSPDIIILVGQAGGRNGITIERVAINLDDAIIPDNNNYQPVDNTIKLDGENAYFSTLPVKAIINNLKDNDIEARISYTAGTYVCNHVMYNTLYHINKNNLDIKAGFIHVPYLLTQTMDKPSMKIEDIVKGLLSIIETTIDYRKKEDLKIIGGTIY
ncbi:pyroglutamyl-peptidase I [Pseudostreptobacillus hongkongensis]|uniref:pyroglutamyl-peptidase I n=1 Tax=Pseudostreptobacillus hongkongensis TaxID=1162717 RepID=UPI0028D763D0|nr:pyroglutamyl-peptidase I [Pseudostreptobacillus hongkongensis]